jgi:hypothetical protein
MECPNDKLLIAYCDGEVGSKRRAAIEQHVKTCERCRERVHEFEAVRNIARERKGGMGTDGDVRAFMTSLPARRPAFIAWGRAAAMGSICAALVVGLLIGRAITPRPQVVEVRHEVAALPEAEVVSALTALQRVKLATGMRTFAADMRVIENLLCGSVEHADNVAPVGAIRLMQQGEDAVASHDFARAASCFEDASKLVEDTALASYAKFQHATILAEKVGVYGTAPAELADLAQTSADRTLSREAGYTLASCQIALGDAWRAVWTIEGLAIEGAGDTRLAELAVRAGNICYDETLDLETAQRCYTIWADAAADLEAEYGKIQETRKRLALLEESAPDRWEPLYLYLRAEKAHPYEAQDMYARIVGSYPESSLADSAFVKWYGLQEARRDRYARDEMRPAERPATELARWENVAESEEVPEEIRAYARLKIADHLQERLDGVEQVVFAYREVVEEFPWTPTADIARERADRVRDTIEREGTVL